MPTHHIIVTGRVQGVFFRASAKKVAASLGLVGWIRNTNEGDVEIVVTGEDKKLQDFEQWCRCGPAQANVTDVIVRVTSNEDFESFKILK